MREHIITGKVIAQIGFVLARAYKKQHILHYTQLTLQISIVGFYVWVKTYHEIRKVWILATHMGGFGWIFKDPYSGSPRSMCSNRSHVGSALIAEALAVKAVLADAALSGLTLVTFWSDSKTLISALSSKDRHIDIQTILHDISVLCQSFVSISFKHIPRLMNCEADSLAKSALYVP